MTKCKALLHIGGSGLQLPSLQWARELGLCVVLTDRNPEALGAVIADRFEVVDGTDVDSLLVLAHEIAREYDLVGAYASSDFGLRAIGAIAEALGRPGCSRLAVERALDKSVAKDIWRRQNLPIPRGVIVKDHKDLFSAVDELGLPVILKPASSSGSQGVRSVWSFEELNDAYASAKEHSKQILVEELVRGRHIDVNGMFVDCRFYPCSTMERYFSEPPYHYSLWGHEPSSLSDTEDDLVYDLVERAARILGIDHGPVKADIVWADEGPVLLELAPRFHGDVSTAYVTPLARNSSPIRAWFAYLAGDSDFDAYFPSHWSCYAGWMGLFPSVEGVLRSIQNVDRVKDIPGIQEVFIGAKRGHYIGPHRDNTTICGFVWATGASKTELHDTLVLARDRLEFVSE